MDRSPRRIASPVNRTPSFEIAILTSPPLSPHHDVPPMEASPLGSPNPPPPPPHSFSPRRKVHESIVREVREYHLQTSRGVVFSPPPIIQIHPAPIAAPESTSSFRTTPEEGNREDEEDDVAETDQEIEMPPQEGEGVVQPEMEEMNSEVIGVNEESHQKTTEETLDNRIIHHLEGASERPIVFPITPFYRRKGSCSKCSIWLGALCALFFLLSIALFLVWVITTDGFRTIGSKTSNVCNTRQCIDIAFRMSSSIEEELEPCENFYRYSCQRYHSQTADKQLSFLSTLKDNALRIMQGLLSAEEDSKILPKSAKLAKNLYSACMNAVVRSSNAPSDLLSFIRNFPCGPLLRDCQNFHSDSYSWERHSGMLDWYAGPYNLIVYARDVHPQDRSKIILQLKPPNLTPIVGPIEKDLVELAQPTTEFEPLLQLSLRQNLLGAFARENLHRDPRDVQTELDEVARLMVDLYIAARQSASMSPNTTYLTIGEMFTALPQPYLREFLDAQLTNVYRWNEGDMLSVQDYDYFIRLSDIIAQTPRRAVANYLVTVTVWNLKQYSYSTRDQFGWRECVDQISQLEIGAKMFVERASQSVNLPKTIDFLQDIKTDFLSVHRSTPIQYLSEINRLGFYVGFPRRLQNEELVWKPVSQLALNDTDYFDSMVRVGKAERDYMMSQIGTYLDIDDTIEFPVTQPTMLFNPHVGAIIIPLAFIEPPIYLPGDDVPMYGIYSSIGVTVLQMIAKVFWMGLDKSSQLECLDNVYRGFLGSNRQRSPSIEPQLLSTIELADAFKTMLYSYAKWQNDHHIHHEKTLPAFDSTDSMRSLMLTFSTMFCNGEGSEPGSDYEAMMNTVAANSRMFSIHFNCNNSSSLFNRRSCL